MLVKLLTVLMIIFSFGFFTVYSEPDISAEGGVLVDASSGCVLFGKNAEKRMKPASTTKILTGIIALESGKKEAAVTISENAAYTEGSSMYLKPGEKISLINLVYGLMLNSGNDAAVAVAEFLSGSVPEFAEAMNSKAQAIGVKNSNFENPNGLDSDKHYTTPYDLAMITRYAMKNKDFREVVSTVNKVVKTEDGENKYLHNHNKLLWMYDGCVGVKTGYTKASGRTLVSSATRDGMTLIAVTMNAPADWNDHICMLNYGFGNYETICFLRKNTVCAEIAVEGGEKEYTGLYPEKDIVKTVKKGAEENISMEFSIEKVPAPVKAGTIGGYAILRENGKAPEKIPLYFKENVKRICVESEIKDVFKRLLESIFYVQL